MYRAHCSQPLTNIGNTCFMNSAIQGIGYSYPLARAIMKSSAKNNFISIEMIDDKSLHFRIKLYESLKAVLNYLYCRSKTKNNEYNYFDSSSRSLVYTLHAHLGEVNSMFDNFNQQGSHECVMELIDSVHSATQNRNEWEETESDHIEGDDKPVKYPKSYFMIPISATFDIEEEELKEASIIWKERRGEKDEEKEVEQGEWNYNQERNNNNNNNNNLNNCSDRKEEEKEFLNREDERTILEEKEIINKEKEIIKKKKETTSKEEEITSKERELIDKEKKLMNEEEEIINKEEEIINKEKEIIYQEEEKMEKKKEILKNIKALFKEEKETLKKKKN